MQKILFPPAFKTLILAHLKDILTFLLEKGVGFNIMCDMKHTHFDPVLPEHISSTFGDVATFVLTGYSFESIVLQKDGIDFEAGFGSENMVSLVHIAYEGVVLIYLHDSDLLRDISLFTNVSHPFFYDISAEELNEIASVQEEGLEHSRLAFTSNPENSKFLKNN
ncbi:hypothetical protein [Helicobacter typhlonius]|uniref:hypothetical protein n=1 Tax=Helicobacter typhlonius TaxID=76936 RepID=UPI002FE3FC0E